MYTLYTMPGAAGLVVHWLLIDIGAPYELRLLDGEKQEQKSPEYLRLNPNGVVPTLMVDGRPVYEAAALAMLLAERHPEARLAPAQGTREREWYLQWMLHLANTLQPAFRAWFYPDEPAGAAHADAVREVARTRIEGVWARLEAHLAASGPWIAGAELSAADFHGAMLARWSRNMPKPATSWPALAEFVQRMKARPSFRTLYEREGLTEWA